MRELPNGIELESLIGDKVGSIFFDSNNLYIASGNLPINMKNVTPYNIEMIALFFKYQHAAPTQSAIRLDIENSNGTFSIRLVDKIIYLTQTQNSNKINLMWQNVGLSELKKVGIWLMKYRKKLEP